MYLLLRLGSSVIGNANSSFRMGFSNHVEASLLIEASLSFEAAGQPQMRRFTIQIQLSNEPTMSIKTTNNTHLPVPSTLPLSTETTPTAYRRAYSSIPNGSSSDLALTNRPYRELLAMVLDEAQAMMAADVSNHNDATPLPPLDHPTSNSNTCGASNDSVQMGNSPHNDNKQSRG